MSARRIVRVLAVAGALAVFPRAPSAAAAPVPGTDCDVFPADNVWNLRVDDLPVEERTDTWLASMGASSTNLHPDFGPPAYGLPYTTVGRSHPKLRVRFRYADESDRGPIRSTRGRRSRAARTDTRS